MKKRDTGFKTIIPAYADIYTLGRIDVFFRKNTAYIAKIKKGK